jgi:hypothetical protein
VSDKLHRAQRSIDPPRTTLASGRRQVSLLDPAAHPTGLLAFRVQHVCTGAGTRTRVHTGFAMEKIRIEQHSIGGLLWVAGWLFTAGFLHLTFWKSVAAIVIWPYYLGVMVSSIFR